MKEDHFNLSDLSQLPNAAERILEFSKGRKVFAFYADMGAGKTTLIKELCRQLGSVDNFSSPTYGIVNEYYSERFQEAIYHIDLYRLKSREELLAAGITEYVSGSNYCFIEWPELAEDFLPDEWVKIRIKVNDNIRNVSIFMG